jgi:hypothetical protein
MTTIDHQLRAGSDHAAAMASGKLPGGFFFARQIAPRDGATP